MSIRKRSHSEDTSQGAIANDKDACWEDDGNDFPGIRERIASYAEFEGGNGNIRSLQELHAYATARNAIETDESYDLKKYYFMIYILANDLLSNVKEDDLLGHWQLWLTAGEQNKQFKTTMSPIWVEDGRLVQKVGKNNTGSLDSRLLQPIRLPGGAVVQKLALVLALTMIWNDDLLTEVDAADPSQVAQGFPILSTIQLIRCSQSLGIFDWEKERLWKRERKDGDDVESGKYFMPQARLRRARGIYIHVNKKHNLVRPGSTMVDFQGRHYEHKSKMGTSENHRQMFREDGWEGVDKRALLLVPPRQRDVIIDVGIILAAEMLVMVMAQATDPRYGVNDRVVDTQPYCFKYCKVTVEQVEKFWIALYELGRTLRPIGLPPISSDYFMYLIRHINPGLGKKQIYCIIRSPNYKAWASVKLLLNEEYPLDDPTLWHNGITTMTKKVKTKVEKEDAQSGGASKGKKKKVVKVVPIVP